MLSLIKRVKDVGELFISLSARFVYNVPTSYNRAFPMLESLGFTEYDEDILSYWVHSIINKEKRPILLFIRERICEGIVAFSHVFVNDMHQKTLK